MTTGRKLILGAIVIASVTAYLAFAGANSSWQYYLTVDECVDQASQIIDSRLRVHGKVAPATLAVDRDQQQAKFKLSGARHSLDVLCTGPIPDNLAEGIEVVVEGKLDSSGRVRGHKVMTKCSSKYASQGSP
ncbi:MAG: cytochrome c maturation protein CcmE [Pirellulaceae bacterium]